MYFNEFENFKREYRNETFLNAAFNNIEEIDSYLDSPECGIGDEVYDEYAEEIFAIEFPTFF